MAESTAPLPAVGTPERARARGRMDAGASRSADNPEGEIQILAPLNFVGETRLAQPVLLWYVIDPPDDAVKVTLNHPNQSEPVIEYTPPSVEPGFHCVALASVGARLEAGVSYTWNVAIQTDTERRDADRVSLAVIRRVEDADTPWYDLVATIAARLETSPDNARLQEMRRALFEEGGLGDLLETVEAR